MQRFVLAVCLALNLSASALAESREIRVPLRDGRFQTAELTRRLTDELHRPIQLGFSADRSIDPHGLKGWLYLCALEKSLGDGFDLEIDGAELVVKVDLDELPSRQKPAKTVFRLVVGSQAAPGAERQKRDLGLVLPDKLDVARPLVVLVHGLDSGSGCWSDLLPLLAKRQYQVALFNYPNDQPVADSGRFLAAEMEALRKQHPELRVNVVTHSMGALVARWYIEGPDYQGGVRRLILLAPPNQGSCYARGRFLSEAYEHFGMWRQREDWNWTWCVTDGLGEAADDLKPGSHFLAELNSRPRRKGVKYTIVAGNRNCGWRYTAQALKATAEALPEWQWASSMRSGLSRGADKLRTRTGKSDGLVPLASVRLKGVRDLVIIPADHATIFCTHDGCQPAAWEVLNERLARK